MIGVDSGWEIYVAGNGGIKTEVAQFLVQGEDRRGSAGIRGAFLQLYREEGWYLERTVHYVERVGLDHVKQRVLEDAESRKALCERLRFALDGEPDPWLERAEGKAAREFEMLRSSGMNPSGQAAAKLAAIPLYVHGEGTREMTKDPEQEWHKVCALDDIPRTRRARREKRAGDIAVFRNAEDEVFALPTSARTRAGRCRRASYSAARSRVRCTTGTSGWTTGRRSRPTWGAPSASR